MCRAALVTISVRVYPAMRRVSLLPELFGRSVERPNRSKHPHRPALTGCCGQRALDCAEMTSNRELHGTTISAAAGTPCN